MTPAPNGTIEIPGFNTATNPQGERRLTSEDAIRIIIHEHPDEFPDGLAEIGLAPRYEWERGSAEVNDVVGTIVAVLIGSAIAWSFLGGWIPAIVAAVSCAYYIGTFVGTRRERRRRDRARWWYLS